MSPIYFEIVDLLVAICVPICTCGGWVISAAVNLEPHFSTGSKSDTTGAQMDNLDSRSFLPFVVFMGSSCVRPNKEAGSCLRTVLL